MTKTQWEPADFVERVDIVRDSEQVLAMPDIPIRQTEDIFRIRVLGLEWDIGIVTYQPENERRIPIGADGKKAGIFLLHGGAGDFKHSERVALLLARKFGYKVVSGTFPGRFYFSDPSRDWPDDTINADGSLRTPIWKEGEQIARDE